MHFPSRRSTEKVFIFGGRMAESPLAWHTVQLYHGSGTVMFFKLNPSAGQPLYQQLMLQICNAIDSGVLKDGDLLPGIRSLAEELVVSHNTVAKAYSELQHQGVIELRHGAGAFVAVKGGTRTRAEQVRRAQERVRRLVESLRETGLSDEEIHRMFVASLFYSQPTER